MVIVKVQKLNNSGAIGVCIPKECAKNVSLTVGDYVNVAEAGDTLHITKVVIN